MLVLKISLPVVTDDTLLCLLPSSWYSVLPHQAPSSTYRVPSTSMYVFLAASLLQGIYIDIASRVVVAFDQRCYLGCSARLPWALRMGCRCTHSSSGYQVYASLLELLGLCWCCCVVVWCTMWLPMVPTDYIGFQRGLQ